jgi:hypothetical protein
MVRNVYTILKDYIIIFLHFYVAEHEFTQASGVLLVLMQIGPSCPHAHSRLTM